MTYKLQQLVILFSWEFCKSRELKEQEERSLLHDGRNQSWLYDMTSEQGRKSVFFYCHVRHTAV